MPERCIHEILYDQRHFFRDAGNGSSLRRLASAAETAHLSQSVAGIYGVYAGVGRTEVRFAGRLLARTEKLVVCTGHAGTAPGACQISLTASRRSIVWKLHLTETLRAVHDV